MWWVVKDVGFARVNALVCKSAWQVTKEKKNNVCVLLIGLFVSVSHPAGKLGALGLWTGLACTASVQALLMSLTVFRCGCDCVMT
jgi:hypothetical protein